MANHIIHKQILDLKLASGENAHQMQEDAKGLYFDKALPVLDELFTRISPNGIIYRFDRLEVDLGRVGSENLEEAFVERLPVLLEEIILEKRGNLKLTSPDLNKLSMVTERGSLFEAFVYFLKTGLMPWWFYRQGKKLPDELFANLPDQLSPAQLNAVEPMLDNTRIRARLSKQFSQHFINQLLKLAPFPDMEEKLEKEKAKEFVSILTQIIKEITQVLDDLSISDGVQGIVRIEILKVLMADTAARKLVSIESITGKLTPETDALIEKSIQILALTLITEGYKQKEIIKLLTDAANILPERTLTVLWLRQYLRGDKLTDKVESWAKKDKLKSTIKQRTPEKDESKKPAEEIEKIAEEGIYIVNAGLVLLWPLLNAYFSGLGLLHNENFKTPEAQERAVLLLQYVVTGNQICPEHELALCKILCGWPLHLPVFSHIKIAEKEKDETNELINAAIKNWKAIGKVSVNGFRESFLQREGKLRLTDSGWNLKVDRKSYDLLLDKLPWMIGMVKLKWMDRVLYVDW